MNCCPVCDIICLSFRLRGLLPLGFLLCKTRYKRQAKKVELQAHIFGNYFLVSQLVNSVSNAIMNRSPQNVALLWVFQDLLISLSRLLGSLCIYPCGYMYVEFDHRNPWFCCGILLLFFPPKEEFLLTLIRKCSCICVKGVCKAL